MILVVMSCDGTMESNEALGKYHLILQWSVTSTSLKILHLVFSFS